VIRSQTWILLPWSRRDQLIEELATVTFTMHLCTHTRWNSAGRRLLSDLVKSQLVQLQSGKKCLTDTMQCPVCWMDYILDTVDFEDRGFAVVLTRWNNFGAGLDLADAKWHSHFTGTMPWSVSQPQHRVGDIRTGFEEQVTMSVDELTGDNERKLFSVRRNQLVYQGSDGLAWKWDRGNSWYLSPSGPPKTTFWGHVIES
jgi:hypothetical protein